MSFHENEAAIAWGYTMASWQAETPMNRAKAIAHHLHKNLRDAFSAEMATSKAKGGGNNAPQIGGYDSMLKSMGLA